MRTTIRFEDDLLSDLRARAAAEGISLTQLVNRALRAGLLSLDAGDGDPAHVEVTFSMGPPQADLTKAGALAATLEDQALIRDLLLGK